MHEEKLLALLPCNIDVCLNVFRLVLLKLLSDAIFLLADQLNAPAAKSESSINIPDKNMVRV